MFLRMVKPVARLSSVAIVFVLGCSGEMHESAARTASMGPLKPSVSPQAAFQTLLDGLKASKPIAFWDFLVPEQQASINTSVRALADAMDPQVWDSTVRNLKKLVRVAETKRDFVLDSPLWRAGGIKIADVKARWSPAVKILKTLVESDLVDLQKMKQFDGRAFLEGTGPTLYAQTHELLRAMKDDRLDRIEDLKATLKTSTDQTAIVVLKPPDPKGKRMEIQMGVSQGKWFAPQIGVVVAFGVQRLSSYHNLFNPYYLADWKDQYLADMDRLGKSLDRLEAAKTADDFQAIVVREIFPVVLQKVSQFRKGPPKLRGLKAVSYSRKATTAMVLFKGTHSPDEPALSSLTARFNRIVPPPERVTFPQVIEGTTMVLVDPVEDINVLAEAANAGEIVKVDAKRKTVILRLPRSATVPAGALPKEAPAAK